MSAQHDEGLLAAYTHWLYERGRLPGPKVGTVVEFEDTAEGWAALFLAERRNNPVRSATLTFRGDSHLLRAMPVNGDRYCALINVESPSNAAYLLPPQARELAEWLVAEAERTEANTHRCGRQLDEDGECWFCEVTAEGPAPTHPTPGDAVAAARSEISESLRELRRGRTEARLRRRRRTAPPTTDAEEAQS